MNFCQRDKISTRTCIFDDTERTSDSINANLPICFFSFFFFFFFFFFDKLLQVPQAAKAKLFGIH